MVTSVTEPFEVLGLDVGAARIGVARANTIAKFPQAIAVISAKNALQEIQSLITETGATLIVVGLPVQGSGQLGTQAQSTVAFAEQLHDATGVPYIFVDESYSSIEADVYQKKHIKNKNSSNDDIAACIVLDRYFREGGHV